MDAGVEFSFYGVVSDEVARFADQRKDSWHHRVMVHANVVKAWNHRFMEFEEELYAERLRLQAQAAGLQSGEISWTEEIPDGARRKIVMAWADIMAELSQYGRENLYNAIRKRTSRSLGYELSPEDIVFTSFDNYLESEKYLSVLEAGHQELKLIAEAYKDPWVGPGAARRGERVSFTVLNKFQSEVNRIFQAYLVGFYLHENSRFVPIESHEMHNAVVAPSLFLLHSQERFASAEKAYQDALKELRNRDEGDEGDAITDAGTALQELLKALGCSGNNLGDLLKSAKKTGLVRGTDSPLTDAVINWVATQRNHGEAHSANHGFDLSDAWMVVHVVGALMIRLSEQEQRGQAN